MSEENTNLLKNLVALGEIDSVLSSIAAEKQKIDRELEQKTAILKAAYSASVTKRAEADSAKERYLKTEKTLKFEQLKLIDRRKALTTLASYKLQEAAGREIEHAAKKLGMQEEELIGMIDRAETLEKEATELTTSYETVKKEFDTFEDDAKATLVTIEERQANQNEKRQAIVTNVPPRELGVYDRVVEKFPTNPVVSIEGNTCGGCFMDIGPQMTVKVARGESLIKCPGCARILYLKREEEVAAEAS